MLSSASHSPAKPANPIEKTIGKLLGGFERTSTGALDKKTYSGSRHFEFSKAGVFSGLKVKKLEPGQTLTPSRLSKRKAGEVAVIADIHQSTRALNLDGTALIQAIKGSQRLNVGHVLDCVSWMEFAASFKQAKPQVAALVVHLAQAGLLPDAIKRDDFTEAIATMLSSPSYSAATAWQEATGPTNAWDDAPADQAQTPIPQRQASSLDESSTSMFNTVDTQPRPDNRDDSPAALVMHAAREGKSSMGAPASSKHATTPPLPLPAEPLTLTLMQPQASSQSSSQSSSVVASGGAPGLARIANELMLAKGGAKLSPELAAGLANLVVALAAANEMSVADMMPHARAVVIENMLVVKATMFQELPHVTPLRQPLRDFIAQSKGRTEAAMQPVAEPEYWPLKVINTSTR